MNKGQSAKPYVFCDFDGTITAEESLQAVLAHFLPQEWQRMKTKLESGDVTLRAGVREMLESISSDQYPDTLDFVRQIPLRPGFAELLAFLRARAVPFVVISGGVRGMVEAGLGDLTGQVDEIFAVDVDDTGPFLKVHSGFEGGDELVAKAAVMDRFDTDFRVVIGDGMTDHSMARHGDLVFAMGRLARYLETHNIDYVPWKDFHDVRKVLEKRFSR